LPNPGEKKRRQKKKSCQKRDKIGKSLSPTSPLPDLGAMATRKLRTKNAQEDVEVTKRGGRKRPEWLAARSRKERTK